MKDLLTALLLKSANDAAVAVAEHGSGGVPAFVRRMNERARELGAADTHFVNPHGLYHPDHYSSAYDLALFAREAMSHELFRDIVAKRAAEVRRPDTNGAQVVKNHNKLLWRADFVDGVKTGYVRQSGHCLVASGAQNGWRLITVVLDSPDVYKETLSLLEYGFSAFRQDAYARPGDALGRASVRRGRESSVPAICEAGLIGVSGPGPPRGRIEVDREEMEAPVAEGDAVGEARLVIGATTVARSPLLAGAQVARAAWLAPLVWALRGLAFIAVAALMVKTHAKIVKAHRRRGRYLPTQSGGFDPRRPGSY
jgi:D-alanyl-D-alanine carboxypeptidase (penicillin-binding protein 5/6)